MNKILGLLLIVMVSTISLNAQDEMSKKEKRKLKKTEQFTELKALVADKEIEFVGDRAYPTGYRNVDLTTNPNFLRLASDSAHAEMPYFGRAYSATPGERGGIRFNTVIKEKSVEINEKKMKVSISFETSDNGDTYKCILEMFPGGSANLSVISNRLQQISYNGSVEEYKPEEEK